jgi:hypothetical protein
LTLKPQFLALKSTPAADARLLQSFAQVSGTQAYVGYIAKRLEQKKAFQVRFFGEVRGLLPYADFSESTGEGWHSAQDIALG